MFGSSLLGLLEDGKWWWAMFISLMQAFLNDLKDPLVMIPRDRLYFSNGGFNLTRTQFFFSVSAIFIGLSLIIFSLYDLLKLPLTGQELSFLFQVPTFVSIMAMILMESTILTFISRFSWGSNCFVPTLTKFILHLSQHLVNKHHQRSEISELWPLLWRAFQSYALCFVGVSSFQDGDLYDHLVSSFY